VAHPQNVTDIVALIDVSGSMTYYVPQVKARLVEFIVDEMPRQSKLVPLTFHTKVINVAPEANLPPSRLQKAIEQIQPTTEHTDVWSAIDYGINELLRLKTANEKHKRLFILFTDGVHTQPSTVTKQSVMDRLVGDKAVLTPGKDFQFWYVYFRSADENLLDFVKRVPGCAEKQISNERWALSYALVGAHSLDLTLDDPKDGARIEVKAPVSASPGILFKAGVPDFPSLPPNASIKIGSTATGFDNGQLSVSLVAYGLRAGAYRGSIPIMSDDPFVIGLPTTIDASLVVRESPLQVRAPSEIELGPVTPQRSASTDIEVAGGNANRSDVKVAFQLEWQTPLPDGIQVSLVRRVEAAGSFQDGEVLRLARRRENGNVSQTRLEPIGAGLRVAIRAELTPAAQVLPTRIAGFLRIGAEGLEPRPFEQIPVHVSVGKEVLRLSNNLLFVRPDESGKWASEVSLHPGQLASGQATTVTIGSPTSDDSAPPLEITTRSIAFSSNQTTAEIHGTAPPKVPEGSWMYTIPITSGHPNFTMEPALLNAQFGFARQWVKVSPSYLAVDVDSSAASPTTSLTFDLSEAEVGEEVYCQLRLRPQSAGSPPLQVVPSQLRLTATGASIQQQISVRGDFLPGEHQYRLEFADPGGKAAFAPSETVVHVNYSAPVYVETDPAMPPSGHITRNTRSWPAAWRVTVPESLRDRMDRLKFQFRFGDEDFENGVPSRTDDPSVLRVALPAFLPPIQWPEEGSAALQFRLLGPSSWRDESQSQTLDAETSGAKSGELVTWSKEVNVHESRFSQLNFSTKDEATASPSSDGEETLSFTKPVAVGAIVVEVDAPAVDNDWGALERRLLVIRELPSMYEHGYRNGSQMGAWLKAAESKRGHARLIPFEPAEVTTVCEVGEESERIGVFAVYTYRNGTDAPAFHEFSDLVVIAAIFTPPLSGWQYFGWLVAAIVLGLGLWLIYAMIKRRALHPEDWDITVVPGKGCRFPERAMRAGGEGPRAIVTPSFPHFARRLLSVHHYASFLVIPASPYDAAGDFEATVELRLTGSGGLDARVVPTDYVDDAGIWQKLHYTAFSESGQPNYVVTFKIQRSRESERRRVPCHMLIRWTPPAHLIPSPRSSDAGPVATSPTDVVSSEFS
jgi:hypothetical protein